MCVSVSYAKIYVSSQMETLNTVFLKMFIFHLNSNYVYWRSWHKKQWCRASKFCRYTSLTQNNQIGRCSLTTTTAHETPSDVIQIQNVLWWGIVSKPYSCFVSSCWPTSFLTFCMSSGVFMGPKNYRFLCVWTLLETTQHNSKLVSTFLDILRLWRYTLYL